MKRLLSLFLILTLLVPLFPKEALALGNVTKISNSANDSLFPTVFSDNKGYLHMAWQEYSGSFEQNPGIFYSRWNGDTWSTPINVSNNTGYADNVSLVTDSSRTVHLVWNDDSGNEDHIPSIRYRTRTESGSLSAIEELNVPPGNIAARNANVAIDASGNPHIAYTALTDSGKSVYWTTKSGGTWSAPILVSKNDSSVDLTNADFAQMRSDASGNLYLVYWDNQEGIYYRKFAAGNWSTPVSVVSGIVEYVRMSVTPQGQIFVTWRSNLNASIMVRWTQSNVWQNAVALTTSSAHSFWGFPIMGVTTDSQERAHVGWGERDEGGLIDIKYRTFVGGVWQSVQDVDLDNQEADSPFVYPDLWDNQHFAWSERNPSTGKWEILYRVAEGTVQNLQSTGGTITASPFSVTQATLTVPSGSLSNTTQIGIQVGPVPENVNQNVVTIPKAYTFRPHGLIFNSPATARIFYTNAEVAGADEAVLRPWLWDSQTGTYAAQTVVRRSTTQNWMEVELSHFSLYGIAAPKIGVTWNQPEVKDGGKKLRYSFTLSYLDGTNFRKLQDKEDDLTLNLKNEDGDLVYKLEYNDKFGPKQKKAGLFEGEIEVKKINLPQGSYEVEMLLNGSLIGTQHINI